MAELHNTIMGKKLIEHTLPEIAIQLKRIADTLEDNNGTLKKSIVSLVNSEPNDYELGKIMRSIWQKN